LIRNFRVDFAALPSPRFEGENIIFPAEITMRASDGDSRLRRGRGDSSQRYVRRHGRVIRARRERQRPDTHAPPARSMIARKPIYPSTLVTNASAFSGRSGVTESMRIDVTDSHRRVVDFDQRHEFKDEMRYAVTNWEAHLLTLF
jgi:hypothetical protein